jgi:hypothetical protein
VLFEQIDTAQEGAAEAVAGVGGRVEPDPSRCRLAIRAELSSTRDRERSFCQLLPGTQGRANLGKPRLDRLGSSQGFHQLWLSTPYSPRHAARSRHSSPLIRRSVSAAVWPRPAHCSA